MATFGLFVLAQAVYKIIVPTVPIYEAIGVVGFIALAANAFVFCFYGNIEKKI